MKKKWISIKTQASNWDSEHKNKNELTVLDQTEVRFRLESTDCALPAKIAQVPIP